MSYENVKLWFAKDESNNIVTVDEINKGDNNTYHCPVCGSKLKPKAIESKRVTSHFAHVDASKCNSESQIHFWFKHKFLEKGDKFTIAADKINEYICKDILIEQRYEAGEYTYRPDVTVSTECGETIYFEMAFSNKKKVKDYLDIWLELKNIVVEVDIKQLVLKDKIPTFKALFYDDKCFNTKRNDTYYNTIDKYKEEKLKGNVDEKLKERIRKLDWFWNDIFKYRKGDVTIEHIAMIIDSIDENEDKRIVNLILNKEICINVYKDYMEYKLHRKFKEIKNYIINKFGNEALQFISKKLKYESHLKEYKAYLGIYQKSWNETSVWDISQKDGERYFMIWINKFIPENITLMKED